MKDLIIFTILFFSFSYLQGQPKNSLDTIRLEELKSKNVFIITEKDNLIKSLGEPVLIDENKLFRYKKRFIHSNEKDTMFFFNVISYGNNKMSYIEKNGKVRLKYLDFKKNKKAVIITSLLKLSRRLRLGELKQVYQYTDLDIGDSQNGILAPWYPNQKNNCFYRIDFSTGEHGNVYIELYFDCKRKLRYMSIGAYDF